ncbi:MAG: HupE/UreJ family protein [Chthoniobacterales bacterium]
MSTGSRLTSARCLVLAFVFCLLAGIASAHPVAQGAMVVTISPQQITVRATVTLEEVLVADAYGPESSRAKSPDDAARRHGAYLLKHLRLSADGRPLEGEQVQSLSPNLAGRKDRFVYEFIYRLSAPASEFRFEEDVLNEFEFAPGNRWEASYVVEIAEEGRPVREGLLMTSRQPLKFQPEKAAAQGKGGPRLDRRQVFRDYCRHGMLHILSGYDHLLFITALVLAVRSLWELVKVVTAFTAAHSITLALSAFDLVRLPSRVVEPMIAASIIFVAVQNAFWPRQTRGWTRLAVAFFFGLFHGLGFAGGLLEAMQGMTTHSLTLAIIGFSAGVELGHQVVVLPTFCALKLARGWRGETWQGERRTTLLSRWGSVAISIAGATYLVAALRAW